MLVYFTGWLPPAAERGERPEGAEPPDGEPQLSAHLHPHAREPGEIQHEGPRQRRLAHLRHPPDAPRVLHRVSVFLVSTTLVVNFKGHLLLRWHVPQQQLGVLAALDRLLDQLLQQDLQDAAEQNNNITHMIPVHV